MPTPAVFFKKIQLDEDIVRTIRNNREIYDVGSAYPGAGEGAKGWAVRPLKSYAKIHVP